MNDENVLNRTTEYDSALKRGESVICDMDECRRHYAR
jgi:hypothetical protein